MIMYVLLSHVLCFQECRRDPVYTSHVLCFQECRRDPVYTAQWSFAVPG